MAQLIREFAAKSNDLSSGPRAHTVEGILSDLHMLMHAPPTKIDTQNTCEKMKISKIGYIFKVLFYVI